MSCLLRSRQFLLLKHSVDTKINNVAPGEIATPINTKLLNDPEKLSALTKNIPLRRREMPI
jgi:glucose 1-dehydrogenase